MFYTLRTNNYLKQQKHHEQTIQSNGDNLVIPLIQQGSIFPNQKQMRRQIKFIKVKLEKRNVN
jgi:hypothetical protein